jgi:transcriptional regulator with XRE-family HTH domain
MNSIHERIKNERNRLELNQGDFAEKAGVKRRAQAHYESGERCPDGLYLAAIASIGVDVQFILTGRRSINLRNDLRSTKDQLYLIKAISENLTELGLPEDCSANVQNILMAVGRGQEKEIVESLHWHGNAGIVSNDSDYHYIPRYNIQAAAGAGAIPNNEEQLHSLAFRYDWLAKRHLSPGNLFIVDVRGESMEPKLLDGDLVLVDGSQADIASGKTYVLRVDGHLLVKNLQLLPGGLVQVASFNSGFPPYQVNLADEALDMAVIGRVVASMHEW